MTNLEKQADEILALQSIFDQKVRVLNHNQYEILIDFDLIHPFHIRYGNQTSTIQYLPSFILIIHYHDEYPSDYPPSFILSCFYFSKFALQNLCQKLDNYAFIKDEVCVYDWIELIKQEITNELILNKKYEEQINDPRALNGYLSDHIDKIYQYLIDYNREQGEKQLRNKLQTCLICADIIPGVDCIRLDRCGHFYCQSCLNNYVKMTLKNGQFGERLRCPQSQCKQALLPTEIKQILQDEQLYEKYEKFTLQYGLELMNDVIWCPRCQSGTIVDNVNDNLGICYACQYTFCRKCEKTFHFQTTCPKDYATVRMRLCQEKEREKQQEDDRQRIGKQQEKELHRMGKQQEKEQAKELVEELRRRRREQEKELQRMGKQQEKEQEKELVEELPRKRREQEELHRMGKQQEKEQEKEQVEELRRRRREQEKALAHSKKIGEEKKPAAVQKYREIVIDLSEEDGLLEEILNSERIESLNTQHCPNCHVRIEKNGGCSHMHCSRCDHHFTWESIQKSEVSNSTSLLTYSSNNSMQIESIKEELNNEGDIVKSAQQEKEKIDSDSTEDNENEHDSKILINNRSLIGSVVISRVSQCPMELCKKFNVKIDQDNWMVCKGCMQQYCFICGRSFNGIRHFKKKCERYTPV